MNLQHALEKYGDQLDEIARARGIGAREDCAVALIVEGITRAQAPAPEPEPAPSRAEVAAAVEEAAATGARRGHVRASGR